MREEDERAAVRVDIGLARRHGLASLGLAMRIGFLRPPPSPLLPWARILGGVEAAGLVVAMCASGILIINYTNSKWKSRENTIARARVFSGTLS